MVADFKSLEPYQQNLFNFIKDVKEGEAGITRSGTPEMPSMTKAQYEALMVEVAAGKKSIFNNGLFKTLTGTSHESLLQTWTYNLTFTTCNGFLGTCATAMGIGAFKSLEPIAGKPSPLSLGQFEIATLLAARGLSRAWVPNENGARPRYGDIFRAAEYHMGICLDMDGDTWNTIESGQGGRTAGYDMLRRKSETWGKRAILGWVDVGTLLSEKSAAPTWLGGWWKVTEGPQTWYYYFDFEGGVYCQLTEPPTRLFAPTFGSAFCGSYAIVKGKYQTVQIRWFTDDPDETFQVSTSADKVPGSKDTRDASKDRLKGAQFRRQTDDRRAPSRPVADRPHLCAEPSARRLRRQHRAQLLTSSGARRRRGPTPLAACASPRSPLSAIMNVWGGRGEALTPPLARDFGGQWPNATSTRSSGSPRPLPTRS